MEEKKVNKSRKSAKKVSMSPFLEQVKKAEIAPVVVEFQIDEQMYQVSIKNHIDFSTRSAIIESTEQIYFPTGKFDPLYGDNLLEFLIMQVYTDIEFASDFDTFDAFKYTHRDAYNKIRYNLPEESNDLVSAVNSYLDLICKHHVLPSEQKNFYDDISSFIDSCHDIAAALVDVLNTAEGSMRGFDANDMKDLISAMKFAGRTDDARVAKAVLDFQKEKEKRVAVKSDVSSDIPHI